MLDGHYDPDLKDIMLKDRLVFKHRTNQSPQNAGLNQTFHHTDYVRESWGRIFKISRFIERAHGFHQDGVILRAT
jgi:hypothetical protein